MDGEGQSKSLAKSLTTSLPDDERAALKSTAEEILRGSESPGIANRWKVLLGKAGPFAGKILTDMISKVVSDAMRGHLGNLSS